MTHLSKGCCRFLGFLDLLSLYHYTVYMLYINVNSTILDPKTCEGILATYISAQKLLLFILNKARLEKTWAFMPPWNAKENARVPMNLEKIYMHQKRKGGGGDTWGEIKVKKGSVGWKKREDHMGLVVCLLNAGKGKKQENAEYILCVKLEGIWAR